MLRLLLLSLSHALAVAVGFAIGIYALPLLTEPAAPEIDKLETLAANAAFSGQFRRDLAGSDFLHWGEGAVSVGPDSVSLIGRIAPGPDYKLYLSPEFVETEEEFERVRERSLPLGDVNTFNNFVVPVPSSVDVAHYNTVVVWCEAFSQFITAARYR